MKWMEVHIDTVSSGTETVGAMLIGCGVDSYVVEDEQDFRQFLEENQKYWDYVDEELLQKKSGVSRVTFYLPQDDSGVAALAQVRLAIEQLRGSGEPLGTLLMYMEDIEDADWENNWKQYYKPIRVGKRLLIVPEWEDAEDTERVKLLLNPGLTFGTGGHASTQLCLDALDRHVCGGERVLDLGCGSGILSIAALLLGAKEAVACDIDEKCVDVAYENAARNGIDRTRYTVYSGDVLQDAALWKTLGSGYDIVCANIVADVVMALAEPVHQLLKENGIFLCSGIIDDRAAEVEAKLRSCGWSVSETNIDGGWYSYLCVNC